MGKWVGIAILSAMAFSYRPSAKAATIAAVDIQLHDIMFSRSTNPIEIWRKMRPQDFIGAPTVWQLIV